MIATHNRRELLGRCLGALCNQTQNASTFEIVVVDDGSRDGTRQLLDSADTPFRLRVLRLEGDGPSAARNAGIRASSGRVCVFLDDDVVATPGLLAEHLAGHEGSEQVVGIGRVTHQPPSKHDWYAYAYAKAWNRRFERLADGAARWNDCYEGNFSVLRRGLDEAGGFSEQVPRDGSAPTTELAFRLHRAGYVPRYLAHAHVVRDGWKRGADLLEDARLKGAAHVELAKRCPAMMPQLLGWFTATTPREIILRRLLLVLRLRPAALADLGWLLPGESRKQLWFGFVSNLAYWRAVRSSMTRNRWKQLARGLPVLLYHAFSEEDESNRFVVTRRAFARQMRLLSVLRFKVATYEDLARSLREGQLPPRRTAVITIDDGYADNREIAAPILERHGFPATIFLVSERLGRQNDWSDQGALSGRPLLSVAQLLPLRRSGLEFGAHTRTHCCLPDAPNDTVSQEIEGSRSDLELVLGSPVLAFAYPQGRYDERAIAAVRRADFHSACTTEPRPVRLDDDPLLIPRIEIKATDSLVRFVIKLWFGGK